MKFQYLPGSFSYPWTLNNFQDLFISGDVDEILSRQALHQLKWCEVKEDVITGDKKFISVNFCQVAIYTYFIHTISMSPPLSKNIYVHIPCQHITDCINISSQRISCHHFSKRRPLDATRQPGKGAPNRLSCSRKTSHLQPANHL